METTVVANTAEEHDALLESFFLHVREIAVCVEVVRNELCAQELRFQSLVQNFHAPCAMIEMCDGRMRPVESGEDRTEMLRIIHDAEQRQGALSTKLHTMLNTINSFTTPVNYHSWW